MSKVLFGNTADGNTAVFGQNESHGISKIYIDGKNQFAPNEFSFSLNRFGNVNQTKIEDYQQGIKKICNMSD